RLAGGGRGRLYAGRWPPNVEDPVERAGIEHAQSTTRGNGAVDTPLPQYTLLIAVVHLGAQSAIRRNEVLEGPLAEQTGRVVLALAVGKPTVAADPEPVVQEPVREAKLQVVEQVFVLLRTEARKAAKRHPHIQVLVQVGGQSADLVGEQFAHAIGHTRVDLVLIEQTGAFGQQLVEQENTADLPGQFLLVALQPRLEAGHRLPKIRRSRVFFHIEVVADGGRTQLAV
ncbi:hypothetical protein VF12_18535, partial [Nostoc linckia z15]